MRSRVALILTILGLAMAVSAVPVTAGTPLGTLDQQQTAANNAHAVAGSIETAQVFTAGITGQLDHVDLWLSTGPGGGGGPFDPLTTDLTVEIWTVASGAPAALIPGASASVAVADVPFGEPLWVQVPISAPSVAGTQYAIVLSAPAADFASCPIECWQWLFQEEVTPPYAAGAAYASLDGGANWAVVATNDPAADFAFRTYVTVPPPATPVASLADAATAPPTSGSPLATLGFAALLIGSLGALVLANARGVVSRR